MPPPRPFTSLRAMIPYISLYRATTEVLFRGFALHYLGHGPLGLNLPLSIAIASLLFGVGHRYQGWRGVVQTCCFGAVMSGLYVATGSLLLAIVVHMLVNLRIALLPPRQTQHRPTIGDLRSPLASSEP